MGWGGLLRATLKLAFRRQVPKKDTTPGTLRLCSWLTGEIVLAVAKRWAQARVSFLGNETMCGGTGPFSCRGATMGKHQSFLLPGSRGALQCSEVSHQRLVKGNSSFGRKLGSALVAASEGGHLVSISVFFLDVWWCLPSGHCPGRAHG